MRSTLVEEWEHPTHGAGPGEVQITGAQYAAMPGYLGIPWQVNGGAPVFNKLQIRHVSRSPQAFLASKTSLLLPSYFLPFSALFASHLFYVAPPPTTQHLTHPTITLRTRPTTAEPPSTVVGMQRRSSGSDDGDDFKNPLPVNVANTNSISLSLGSGLDATPTAQATSAQTHGRAPNHKSPGKSDSRRTSFDLRSHSARSRRSGNFSWKPTSIQNGSIEKAPLALAVEPSTVPVMAPKDDEDSEDVDKSPDSKGPRRPRSRNPWAFGCLTLLATIIGIGFLAAILNSSATRCLDIKGCIMSYMRPAYVKLSEFDTEHTRFGSKYSLYLYREMEVDEEVKVRQLDDLLDMRAMAAMY